MHRQLKTLVALTLMVSSWNAMALPQDPVWSVSLKGNISSSVAIGTNLYVGTADGKIQAINSTTGATVWSFTTGGNVGATPSVSADGTTVYAASYDKNLYALDATTGIEKWRFTADSYIFSSPVIDELGVIYAFSTNGIFYVIDPATGEEESEYSLGVKIDSSPAILSKNGVTEIFIGSAGGYVMRYNVDTGSTWTFTSGGGKPMTSPVIGPDNTIYVASHDGYVYALKYADGTLKWKTHLSGRVASSLSIDRNTLYVASYDFGTLYAVDMSNGAVWWEYQTGGTMFSTSAVGANGNLYIGTKTKLLAINEITGALVWSYPTGNLDSPVAASPVIASNGNVLGITQNGTLFAVTGDGTTLAPSSWPMFRYNNKRNGLLLDSNGDGIPDAWAAFYGITDPNGNPDGDGNTNLQEYLAGTNPTITDTIGNGLTNGANPYPTHVGTPTSFLALADRIVTRVGNPITILGSDLMANDNNPASVSLSITATTNTTNTVNTKPTVTSGNLSYNPTTANATDEFAYTLSGGGNTRSGLVEAIIVGSTADVVGSVNNEIVFAGGNNKNTDAGAGDDLIYDSAAGNDTFLQGSNDGHDRLIINNATVGRSDVLKFKSDVPANQVNLYKDGADLIFNVRQTNANVSNITVVNAIKNQTNNGVTAVQFANGVDAQWDLSKLKAVDDHVQVTSASGVITFTPDTYHVLTENDFVPTNVQFYMSVVSGTETGGTVALVSSYVDQHVVFTLNSGATSGSFQYTITDPINAADTSTARVYFTVVASDVTSYTFNGDADDNVLEGTPGNDTFNSSPGFDIINGVGGQDTINFAKGGDKDTFYYLWDDGGTNHLGDTINLQNLNRSDISLERQGLDIVAKIKSTGENIRLQSHHFQEATINAAIGAPYGLLPFNQITFADMSISDSGFTSTSFSNLAYAAIDNATNTCTGGSTGSSCIGTSGNDTISGGTGNDVIFGRDGADSIHAGNGDDIVYGEMGNDTLFGDAGDDQLYGDEGADNLIPGTGNNYMNGGSGLDIYTLDQNQGNNIIDNFDLTTHRDDPNTNTSVLDTLWFSAYVTARSWVKFSRSDDDLVVKVSDGTTTSISNVLNYFSFSGYNELDARFRNFGSGSPTGALAWNGSCSDPHATDGLTPTDSADSGFLCIKTRVLYDMAAADTACAGVTLTGYDTNDVINGGCGNDTIYAGKGVDIVHGNAGNDTIYPYWGSDTIYGDAGNDTLYGAYLYGFATLNGGQGSDSYVFTDNESGYVDAVQASDPGIDKVQIKTSLQAMHDYWLYATDFDSNNGGSPVDLVISGNITNIIVIRDWNDPNNQVAWIEVNINGACQKMLRAKFSAYMAAIVAVAGSGVQPTAAQMDAVIGNTSDPNYPYWAANTCGN